MLSNFMTAPSARSNRCSKPNFTLGLVFSNGLPGLFNGILQKFTAIRNLLAMGLVLTALPLYAQEPAERLQISGYMETYYAFDFNQPATHERPSFLYNFKRHNEFALNLALVQLSYSTQRIRTKLGAMAGSYAQYNLADEPIWAQFIYEASVGVQLLENLWLDVGIMPSHIGFESAIGADCWHLSRSLLAENSPYFLTGARFTYAFNNKLEAILWVTNGWQNVQRPRGFQSPGVGIGVVYKPSDDITLNYANYWGSESVSPSTMYRFFNNFYVQKYSELVNITLGADFGIEQRVFRQGFNHWYGIALSLQKPLTDQLTLAGRAEYYADTQGVILEEGMRLSGFSINLDYNLTEKAIIRIEGRQFISPEPIFPKPTGWMNRGNLAVNTSLALRF